LRSYPVGDYLIFYRVQRRDVIIQRVLHARRNIDRLIGGR
jgi:plasmid stabilization system protein ParE